MPAKKKKGGKKGKKKDKKKTADGDEETKNENEELKVDLPKYGWIKITVSVVQKYLISSHFFLIF